MKLRSFFYLLATVATGLFLIGTIGFFWVFSQSPLGLLQGNQDQPTAVMFVPKQAPVMASLMVNPDRLESLRLVTVAPGERRQARTELEQFRQSILGNTDLDYKRDIQPWLGNEITLAVTTLDIDRDTDNGRQPGYLLAVTTKDAQRSREFLQLFWQKKAIAGTDLVFEQYKGTKLIYGNRLKDDKPKQDVDTPKRRNVEQETERPRNSQPSNSSFASAVVGNQFVLFANSPKVLRDAINNVQATELGLGSSRAYQTAIDHLTQKRIGVAFVNLPQLSALAKASSIAKTDDVPATDESLAIALGLNRQGLMAETALLTIAGQNLEQAPSLSQPVGALKYVPAISPFAASGINLNRFWTDLSQEVSGYQGVAELVNQPLEALQERWKLDLPNDVFNWVKGEYALGLVPRSREPQQEAKAEPGALPATLDWVFIADKSVDQNAQAAINHLDDLAKQQGISVGSLRLNDQTVYAWTRLLTTGSSAKRPQTISVQAEVAGVHASIGNYEVFSTSVEAMNDVLKASKNSLSESETFKQAIAPLPKPNDGYLYVDWATTQPVLEKRFPVLKVIELAGKPFLSHLRSLTVSSYGRQAGVQRGGAFVRLEG